MEKLIKEILNYGVMAPSGDNSQPWYFKINGPTLSIFNIPERDNLVLNFQQSGSYMAHGGLIENCVIAASNLGCGSDVVVFPDEKNPDLVVRITFFKDQSVKKDTLFQMIEKRHTNRRKYEIRELETKHRDSIVHTSNEVSGAKNILVKLVENPSTMSLLGPAGSSIEKVILENELLHSLLFKDVVWSEKEEQKRRSGLYIETMEFNPVQKIVFRLASSWKIITLLNKIGLSKLIAKEDGNLYSKGAAMGVIVLQQKSKESWIIAGRILQRVWLKATLFNLGLQPVSGIPFAMQRIKANKANQFFSVAQIENIKKNYTILEKNFSCENYVIAIMFRLGYSKTASARCTRKKPDIL